MIYSININDATKSPYKYIDKKTDNFNLKNEYLFKPGTNILVGNNGCGKSTLLNILRSYTLCKDYFYSRLEDMLIGIDLFQMGQGLLDGIDVKFDCRLSTFNLFDNFEDKDSSSFSEVNDLVHLLDIKHLSNGEKNNANISKLFDFMFGKNSIHACQFPIKDIKKKMNSFDSENHPWRLNLKNLLSYYQKNNNSDNNDCAYTILMDEPDKNFDIFNLEHIFAILSHEREDTQIIASIHNPVLIYRLMKCDHINFIELSPNYLYSIKRFIEKI